MTGRPSLGAHDARPAALCARLGLAAFAVAFFGALLLGRGLTGGGLDAFVIPLALAGSAAVGIIAAFVAAAALAQPRGTAQARRALAVATPLALLLALFAVVAGPAEPLREPFVAPAPTPSATGIPAAAGPRRVAVPTPVPVEVLGVRSVAPSAPARLRAGSPAPRPTTAAAPPSRTTDPVDLVPRNTERCWHGASDRNPHGLVPCPPKA